MGVAGPTWFSHQSWYVEEWPYSSWGFPPRMTHHVIAEMPVCFGGWRRVCMKWDLPWMWGEVHPSCLSSLCSWVSWMWALCALESRVGEEAEDSNRPTIDRNQRGASAWLSTLGCVRQVALPWDGRVHSCRSRGGRAHMGHRQKLGIHNEGPKEVEMCDEEVSA